MGRRPWTPGPSWTGAGGRYGMQHFAPHLFPEPPKPMQTETPRRRWIASEDAQQLWKEYRRTQDASLRDRLIMTYAPLVKYIAYRKVRELPASCQVEDFISCGLEALITAIDRYDPEKGATLEQFAWTRIHGAILDELRRQDWAPRSVRRWERDIAKAADEFTTLHGRRPTQPELAESMGTTVAALRKRRDEITQSDLTSLNTLVLSDDETTIERIDTIASTDVSADPLHAAAKEQAKEKFREVFAQLPQREREIAVMLYVKHLTLAEIGEILGVSESRVCQIHGQLKKTLRAQLDDDAPLFQAV